MNNARERSEAKVTETQRPSEADRLDVIAQTIREDARKKAERYLRRSEVPAGGE